MSAPPLTFPEWARQLRALHSMTQVEFAALVGVHPMTVSKWERGVEVPRTYSNLARLLVEINEAAHGTWKEGRGIGWCGPLTLPDCWLSWLGGVR